MPIIKKFGRARTLVNGIFLVILVGVVAVFLLSLINFHMPALRCEAGVVNDPRISHLFEGDTITTIMLICVAGLAPFVQMVVTEWFVKRKTCSLTIKNVTKLKRLKQSALRAVKVYKNYLYGISVVILLNDIAKCALNAPRPHWLDTCKPQFVVGACKNGWLYDYECSNSGISRMELSNGRKSFPSGHSAIGFYAALFMMIYQHRRVNMKITGTVFLLWLHILWFGFAIICGLSRITDYRHHPIDVVFGGCLGAIGGILTVLLLCKSFKSLSTVVDKLDQNENSGKLTELNELENGI